MSTRTTTRGRDLGIDLGTANTLVHVAGRGIVVDEPSVVAVNNMTGAVLCVGTEARQTIGRTPAGITAVRPLRDGVIADFEVAERMLGHFIGKAGVTRFFGRPRVVVCVPSGITGVERRAVMEAGVRAGARQVHLIEEPLAAAIGADLPVAEPTGCMVVDIGGGTTEVAVISLGGVVAVRSLRVAGDAMDTAISSYVRKELGVGMGEQTTEEVKKTIGSAAPTPALTPAVLGAMTARAAADPRLSAAVSGDPEDTAVLPRPDRLTVRGRDLLTGLPRHLELTEELVRHALSEPLDAILAVVRRTLDACPPELAGDIVERGIVLTGGGALLRGLDVRLRRELDLPVTVAEDPLNCVVRGAGRCVEDRSVLDAVLDGGGTKRPVLRTEGRIPAQLT